MLCTLDPAHLQWHFLLLQEDERDQHANFEMTPLVSLLALNAHILLSSAHPLFEYDKGLCDSLSMQTKWPATTLLLRWVILFATRMYTKLLEEHPASGNLSKSEASSSQTSESARNNKVMTALLNGNFPRPW